MNKHWKLYQLLCHHPLPPNVQWHHIQLFSGPAQGLVTDGHPLVCAASLTSISAGKRQQINSPVNFSPHLILFIYLFISAGVYVYWDRRKDAFVLQWIKTCSLYLYNYSLPHDEWYLTSMSSKLLPFGCKSWFNERVTWIDKQIWQRGLLGGELNGWCAVYYQLCKALFISLYLWGHQAHCTTDACVQPEVCQNAYVL